MDQSERSDIAGLRVGRTLMKCVFIALRLAVFVCSLMQPINLAGGF